MPDKKFNLLIFGSCASLFLWAGPVLACSCNWAGPFAEMAMNSKLVIRAKVKEYGPRLPHGENLYESVKVRVVNVLKGRHESSSLVILGDPGHLCRPYITPTQFKKGHEYLFALHESKKSPQGLSVCGEFWMEIDGGMARGQSLIGHRFVEYSITLDKLLMKIREE